MYLRGSASFCSLGGPRDLAGEAPVIQQYSLTGNFSFHLLTYRVSYRLMGYKKTSSVVLLGYLFSFSG